MKIINNESLTVPVEIIQEVKKNVEYKLLGKYRRKIDGGTIFSVNMETGAITEAKYRTNETLKLEHWKNTKQPTQKNIDVEKGMIYVEALNKKTVLDRLKKGKIILST